MTSYHRNELLQSAAQIHPTTNTQKLFPGAAGPDSKACAIKNPLPCMNYE